MSTDRDPAAAQDQRRVDAAEYDREHGHPEDIYDIDAAADRDLAAFGWWRS